MASGGYFGGTQAFVSVRVDLKKKILEEGYVARRRNDIPGHRVMARGVQGMLNYEDDKSASSVILEVHGVPAEWIQERAENSVHIKTTDRKATDHGEKVWLKPQYLREGKAIIRDAMDFTGASDNCMFCGTKLTDQALIDMRRSVGEAVFTGTAFMCSPCTNEECVSKMTARSQRLLDGETMELFHRTSKEVARSLRETTHGKMIRGDFYNKAGAAGGGIYFGHTVRECMWKAEPKAKDDEKVTLKCRVWMGKSKLCKYKYDDADKSAMFRRLVTHPDGPFDSVILDRAAKGAKEPTFPVPPAPVKGTRIEDIAIGDPLHPGYEFVVYSWDQVDVLEEVAEDPVPAGFEKKQLPTGEWVRAT